MRPQPLVLQRAHSPPPSRSLSQPQAPPLTCLVNLAAARPSCRRLATRRGSSACAACANCLKPDCGACAACLDKPMFDLALTRRLHLKGQSSTWRPDVFSSSPPFPWPSLPPLYCVSILVSSCRRRLLLRLQAASPRRSALSRCIGSTCYLAASSPPPSLTPLRARRALSPAPSFLSPASAGHPAFAWIISRPPAPV